MMGIKILVLVLAVSLTQCQNSTALVCHYSCSTCVGESYTLCTACNDTTKNITIVEDPSVSQPDYVNSNVVSGVCIGQVQPKANALGIVMLLICVGIAAAVRTQGSIYLISMLQTISLISFVQVAWVNPVGYLLQTLQYFMIFSWVGSGYKVQDQSLRQRQYYRLDVYLHESKFLPNIALVGIVNIILLCCVVGLLIYRGIKKNKQGEQKYINQIVSQKSQKFSMKQQIQPTQSQREQKIVSQYIKDPGINILQFVLTCFLICFYFCIQETSLMIVTSLRFERPLPASTIALSVIYVIILLFYMMYLFINPLFYYPNKKSQFVNIWKKIGLPVLIIVPYQINYILLVFMLAFAIIQSSVDYNGEKIKLLSRMTLYKIVDLLTIFMAGIYIIVEVNNNLQLPTNIIRVFLAICILSFFICLFIQLFFGIVQTYCMKNSSNQIKNQTEVDDPLPINATDETINQVNIFDNNINNTRQNTKNNLQIYIQDINDKNTASFDNSPMNANYNGLQVISTAVNNQEQERKKKQEIMKREAQQRAKKQAEEKARKQSQQRARKQAQQKAKRQAEQRARKQAEEKARRQADLKNKLQAEQRAKKQAQQKARKQAQQRARKKKQQDQRKKRQAQEAQKRRKQLEQQQKARKAAQQAARLKRQQQQNERREAQEAARKKKQQEEDEQAEQRARKKRQYIAQMDPALRKRYGF